MKKTLLVCILFAITAIGCEKNEIPNINRQPSKTQELESVVMDVMKVTEKHQRRTSKLEEIHGISKEINGLSDDSLIVDRTHPPVAHVYHHHPATPSTSTTESKYMPLEPEFQNILRGIPDRVTDVEERLDSLEKWRETFPSNPSEKPVLKQEAAAK